MYRSKSAAPIQTPPVHRCTSPNEQKEFIGVSLGCLWVFTSIYRCTFAMFIGGSIISKLLKTPCFRPLHRLLTPLVFHHQFVCHKGDEFPILIRR